MSADEEYLEKYEFQIFEFLECTNEDGQLELDIAPSKWIKYKFEESRLVVKYPNRQSAQVLQQLQSMVKSKENPSKSWPEWPIAIKGGANQYDVAEKRIEILKTDPYAFTSDDENEYQKKADHQTELYKKEALAAIMSIPKRNDNSSSEEMNDDSEHSDTSVDSIRVTTKTVKGSAGKSHDKTKKGNVKFAPKKKLSVSNKPKKNLLHQKSGNIGSLNDLDDGHDTNNKSHPAKAKSQGTKMHQQKLKFISKSNQNRCDRNTDTSSSAHKQIDDGRTSSSVNSSPDIEGNKESRSSLKPCNSNNKERDDGPHSTHKPTTGGPLKEPLKKMPQEQLMRTSKFSPEGEAIIRGIAGVKVDVQELLKKVNQLLKEKSTTDNAQLLDELEKLELKWPLETVEEWKSFNKELKKNGDLSGYFIRALKNQLDTRTNSPRKSMHNICRMIFVKDLIMNFTPLQAAKDGKKPFVFKESHVYSMVRDVLYGYHTKSKNTPIGKEDYHDALKHAFGNSKDWGGRAPALKIELNGTDASGSHSEDDS